MVWIIIRKEFLLNLVNFRFIAGFILCFVLSGVSALILTQDYAEQIKEYSDSVQKHMADLKNAKVYSEVKVTVDKPPEPLGLLCGGVDKYLSTTFTVEHGQVPTVRSSTGRGNMLLAGLHSLDFALIVRIIFSLLALLFVYDSISGEREHGTLSLIMSNPLPRYQVLLGKYLGILLSLFIPILCSMLVGTLIIIFSPSVKLNPSDGIRLVIICIASLLYISVFCNIGVFISSKCSRSTTSLIFLLFFWVIFIFLLPKASSYIASYAKPIRSLNVIEDRNNELWQEFQHKVDEFEGKHPANGISILDYDGRVFMGEKQKMNAYLTRVKFCEPLRIQYADKEYIIRQEYIQEHQRQSAIANNLARISPSVSYENLVSTLAKTDAQTYLKFIDRLRTYRHELINYLQGMKIFESYTFFTRQKEEEMLDGEEFERWFMENLMSKWEEKFRQGKKISEVEEEVWNSVKPLNTSSIPRFEYRGLSITDNIRYTIIDEVILITLNLLFFLLAYVSFLRKDVKI